jgi:hypothetical protein
VRTVVEEYLLEARRLGFQRVRIIHGKGVSRARPSSSTSPTPRPRPAAGARPSPCLRP